MRIEDAGAATALLDAALRSDPAAHTLWALRANLLHHAGDLDGTLVAACVAAGQAERATAIGGVHASRTHPLDQSLRHGSQAAHLHASDDPTIRAFFQAVDGPIRRHLEALGGGRDPLRARDTGGYRYQGVWSVRLRPSGFHAEHIHTGGWISSARYFVRSRTEAASREAWIKFGEPGIPTRPALGPEHFIRPEPGLLVLFPSYMGHGTVPFSGGAPRLSVALDLLPGAPGARRS